MTDLARLREPFPAEQIGKLPRVWCKACRDSGSKVCSEHVKIKCDGCRNNITKAHLHLDYVGHAEVTHRLLDADPAWYWEPLALDEQGLPAVRREGKSVSLWIKLTVCGVTRLGVGIVDAAKDELDKQLISDALRNAAMRFGVALDLWAKSELDHTNSGDSTPSPDSAGVTPPSDPGAPSSTGSVQDGSPSLAHTQSPAAPGGESPAGDARASAPSAPGRSQSDGGSTAGEVGAPAVSDSPEALLDKEERRTLIGRFNDLPLAARSEAQGLKRSLGVKDWYTAPAEDIAKLRAKVTELEAAVA